MGTQKSVRSVRSVHARVTAGTARTAKYIPILVGPAPSPTRPTPRGQRSRPGCARRGSTPSRRGNEPPSRDSEEFEELLAQLDSLPPGRHAAIARMCFKQVAECPVCGEPIRRCDKRTLIEIDGKRQLVHLSLACAGREPERELSGEELQKAKDAPLKRLETLRAEAAGRRREWKS